MTAFLTSGLHHVTAICGDPAASARFYRQVLGLRLLKKTVNFDNPSSYHLYFGGADGTPGSLLTFFPWPDIPAGQHGTDETRCVYFNVAAASLPAWQQLFAQNRVDHDPLRTVFGLPTLSFRDPDGLELALVGANDQQRTENTAPVLGKLAGVRVMLFNPAPTLKLFETVFGWKSLRSEGGAVRLTPGGRPDAPFLDIVENRALTSAKMGRGCVHHIAFRAGDRGDQELLARAVEAAGIAISPSHDRAYFHSIYFRPNGGVQCELTSDTASFSADEPADALGQKLVLPSWLEAQRQTIERALPPLDA